MRSPGTPAADRRGIACLPSHKVYFEFFFRGARFIIGKCKEHLP